MAAPAATILSWFAFGRAFGEPDPNPLRARHPAVFPPVSPRTASYDVGASDGAAQFALLGLEGVDVAIRWRPLRLIRPSRILCPRAGTCSDSKPSTLVARRRLATSWMLTLRAPSFHVGAGGAFTRPVPTSDALCHHPAPACRLLFARPPASAPRAALERVRSVSPCDQNRSTVPSLRGAISSVARRWRNDSRRLPSCRALCLPPQIHMAFQPRTPDASRRRTEPFVMPSLLRSSLTPAHRFARGLL